MNKYYCYVLGGDPPRFKHENLGCAIVEAKRLNDITKKPVEILEIVGVVKNKEVPVTKTIQDVELFTGDDLPF